MNKILSLVIVLSVLTVGSQGTTSFLDRFYSFGAVPVYPLGYLLANYTVKIQLTMPSTNGYSFNDEDFFKQVGYVDLTIPDIVRELNCTDDCNINNYKCTMTCPVIVSGPYQLGLGLENAPAKDDGTNPVRLQSFQVEVSQYLTEGGESSGVTPVLKYTDAVRDLQVKLIYIDQTKNATFSLYPVAQFANSTDVHDPDDGQLYLFEVSSVSDSDSIFDISGQPNLFQQLNSSYTSASKNLTYTTTTPLDPGYYVLVAFIPPLAPSNLVFPNSKQLTFQSDPYACPFPPAFPDYNRNFQPCNGNSVPNSQPGFPCVIYNYQSSQCTACLQGYQLVNGSCSFDTTCPQGQYFHFGQCLPISQDCLTYDSFTGYCLTCKVNDSSILDGKCIPKVVTCGNRQFVLNKTCVNVSDLCLAFSNTTGKCLSCFSNFDLVNGTCVRQVVVCPNNQYLASDNLTCKNFPANCPSFDTVNEVCRTCARGFYLSNGICQQVVCPARQVPSRYGIFCETVSELCGDYDPVTGDCLSCAISNYFVQNGDCVEAVSPLAGCQERESLGFGECLNAERNCQSYNLQTRNCDKCLNNYFKDFTGRCTLQNAVCQSDEVSIQGVCVQIPRDCAQVDGAGLCVRCTDPVQYRIINGQCVFTAVCSSRQYRTETGVCVEVSADCLTFNPTTGVCITCTSNRRAEQGICCAVGLSVLNKQCVDATTYRNALGSAQGSTVATCVAFHPVLGTCLACNGNFQVNPVMPTTCI